MRLSALARATAAFTLICIFATQPAFAWGHDGHSMINRLAAQYLPDDVPAFLRNGAALDAMDYLGPEPDRWHNKAYQELYDRDAPNHFIDLEYSNQLGPLATLPRDRRDFVALAEKAAATQHEPELVASKVGMQPWEVEEGYEKLTADMRLYRKLLAANVDTAPIQLAILYEAGILGHYVADGSQPLHATYRYNGWTGLNPDGYVNDHKIHSRFESTYVAANMKREDIAPLVAAAKPEVIGDEWLQYAAYINRTNSFVEKVYQLDKLHGFDGAGTPEAKTFTQQRLADGAIELRDLIYSAWVHAAEPIEEYKGPA